MKELRLDVLLLTYLVIVIYVDRMDGFLSLSLDWTIILRPEVCVLILSNESRINKVFTNGKRLQSFISLTSHTYKSYHNRFEIVTIVQDLKRLVLFCKEILVKIMPFFVSHIVVLDKLVVTEETCKF